MNKKYIGYGERPSDKDFFKITKTQYDPQPEQNIGNYELILNTPTVKAYLDRPSETIVLSIRGTTDGRDVTADTMIPFNRLKYSNRYNEDKNIIASLINQYPPDDYDYYGTGHSLGSALLRQLQREFPFIKDTVTFNGAVQPYDIIDQKANLNKSYYTEDDALYKLGGRLLNNKVVIPSTVHTLKIPSVLPTPAPVKVGSFVYNASQGHKLDNFEGVLGGAISRMREKLQKMTVKEIKEAVKNELNGAIKGYSKMKKEELIDAIRDYQKNKKGSKKSEEPKVKEAPIKVSKREQFLLDEREKKVIYITEQLIDKLPDIYKSISELVKFKKIKNKCKKLYAKSKNMLLRIEDDKPTIDLFDKKNDKIKDKYGVGCPKNRRGINLTGANDIFKEKLRYINNLINEFFFIFIDRGIYREPYYYLNWYRNKYPEEQKKLSIKYVKNGMGWTDNFRLTDKELEQINKGIEIGTKGLFNKVPDFEKLKDELNILEKEILYSGDDFDYYRNYKKSEEPKITPKKSEDVPLVIPKPEPTKEDIKPLFSRLSKTIKKFEKKGKEHGAVIYDSWSFIQSVAYIVLLLKYETQCAIVGANIDESFVTINSLPKSKMNIEFYKKAEILSNDLLDCINRGDKLIAFPLSLRFGLSNSGHANLLIYRPLNKTIERFEPHGSEFRGSDGDKDDKSFNETLKTMFEVKMKPYLKEYTPKFISPEQICPVQKGFQSLESSFERGKYEKEGGGFCGMWSLFLLELIFKNPTESTSEIISEALYITKQDPQYLKNVIRGYVLRIERLLNDYIKKIDANDGFTFATSDNIKNKKVIFQQKLLDLLLSLGGKNSQIKGLQETLENERIKNIKYKELEKLLLSKSMTEITDMLLYTFKTKYSDALISYLDGKKNFIEFIIKEFVNPLGGKYNKLNEEKIFKYFNATKTEEPKTKGGCCMCHTKDVVRGGAIEERKIESLEDFKTTELRKIASIFNKFFKIKLTKLTRNEIIRELSKYIYLNESGSIFVNEDDLFFSLKPKDVLKEIETKKLQNKIKKEAKPKTRREILQKEKIGVLKALLISLGGDPTYKLNGRITQFPKRSVIDEILVLERKIRKE